jgi:hypothetical protein
MYDFKFIRCGNEEHSTEALTEAMNDGWQLHSWQPIGIGDGGYMVFILLYKVLETEDEGGFEAAEGIVMT